MSFKSASMSRLIAAALMFTVAAASIDSVHAMSSKSQIKGGHSSSQSPSKRNKHQAGEAQRQQQQDPDKKLYATYKQKGGQLSKANWIMQGKPTRG